MSALRHVAAALVLLFAGAVSAQQPTAEFDAVSIKRNPTNTVAYGYPPYSQGNQFRMIGFRMRDLIPFGYPVETQPIVFIGLPDWAESESYDLIAKGKPNPTADERRQMWQALFRDRLRLQAHDETRDRAGYQLVFARSDKRLGPGLKVSTIDCTQPPAPRTSPGGPDGLARMLMQRCGLSMTGNGKTSEMYSGSASIGDLAKILPGYVQRPVVDRTGLDGQFALRLQFVAEASPPATQADAVDPAPILFTALQEQLGLKLEPTTIQGQVLVIDHIERPSEN